MSEAVEFFGRHTGLNVRRDEIQSFRAQFARSSHTDEVYFRVDRDSIPVYSALLQRALVHQRNSMSKSVNRNRQRAVKRDPIHSNRALIA